MLGATSCSKLLDCAFRVLLRILLSRPRLVNWWHDSLLEGHPAWGLALIMLHKLSLYVPLDNAWNKPCMMLQYQFSLSCLVCPPMHGRQLQVAPRVGRPSLCVDVVDA